VGAGGCSGGQVCAADGKSFGACACGSGSDGGTDAGPSADASNDATSDAAAEAGGDAALDAPAEAAIDAGILSPGSLGSGLVLWLDDAAGSIVANAGTLAVWKDQSGHGFDVSLVATGEVDVVSNALNGHTILDYRGGMVDTTTMAPLTGVDFGGDYLVEIVGDVAGSAGSTVWSVYDGVGGVTMSTTASGVGVADVSSGSTPQLTASAAAGAFHILGIRRKGMPATLEVRVDGASTSVADASPFVANPPGAFGVGNELEGKLVEIVVYTGTLSDVNVVAIENYLKAKYALP
jgi:hypothetical protein